jgi:hypothetical protein
MYFLANASTTMAPWLSMERLIQTTMERTCEPERRPDRDANTCPFRKPGEVRIIHKMTPERSGSLRTADPVSLRARHGVRRRACVDALDPLPEYAGI